MSAAAADEGRPRVAFRTLGCRLNQYDTEAMKAALGDAVRVVPWDEAADVYVLNSCTVTGRAEQECRRLARQVKRRRPRSRVVVAGCYAQNASDRLERLPEVDGIIGTDARLDVAAWLPALLAGERTVRVGVPGRVRGFPGAPIREFDGRSRAHVKVQDGCDLRCSYCAIRRARGPARSRPLADALRQVEALAAAGFRELVLTGVHLGAWGRDLSPRRELPDLLAAALAAFPDLRFRLGSLHPDEVGSELLGLVAGSGGRLRPHLHVSLQSGADAVLRRMRRPYDGAGARRALAAIGAALPDAGVGADLIVGFPGETEADFAATLDLVAGSPLTYLHVFRFSPRPGTPAAALPDPVHPETVAERGRRLRAAGRRRRERFARAQVGRWREAVAESPAGEPGWQEATTDNYVTVLVPAGVEPGALLRVRPDRWTGGRLLAAACEPLAVGATGAAAEAAP